MVYVKQTWTDFDPATPISADRLTHIEDGIYDVSINKAEKTNQAYNATDYGFLTTNSAAANTTALDALNVTASASGRSIYIPTGSYAANALTVKVPMFGDNRRSTIITCNLITINISNVTLSDMKIVAKDQTAIIAANVDDITLDDIHVDFDAAVTTNWLAFNPYNVNRLRVRNCRFRIGGLQLSLCQNFLVTGNYWGCEYVNTNEPCHISGQSSGIFTNNNIYRTLTDGVDLYSAGHYCIVSNNRITGIKGAAGIECKVTMSDDPGNTSSEGNVFEGTIISNNVLRDFSASSTSTRVGIYAEYVDNRAVPAFSVAETNRGIIISNNVLQDFNITSPGVTISYWGIAYTGHNGLISNNVIRNAKSWLSSSHIGIKLSAPTGSKSVGVAVVDNNISAFDTGKGIEVGNADRCRIEGNMVRGDVSVSLETKYGVSFAANVTLNHCSISNNIFECNTSSAMGLVSNAGAVLNRCRVQGNIFYNCGCIVYATQYCIVSGNILENATNSQTFSFGIASTSSRGTVFSNNHVTMSSDYGMVLTDQDGFSVTSNSFKDTARGLLLIGNTRNGIVANNVSITQTSGQEFPHYSGVSAGDQATMALSTNMVI